MLRGRRIARLGLRKSRENWGLAIGLLAAAVYTAVLGSILSLRYWAFRTFAWDLGNFNQGLWTALFAHRLLFYYTADTPSGNVGSLLSSHFSPILYLVLPFYAIAPNPSGLLFIQAAGLAAGIVPLYFLSRRLGLSNGWALLLELGYLLSPVLMGVGWYDFHAEAFLPFTVLLVVYCYYFSNRWAFYASWVLCLATIETVAPLLFLFALAGLVGLGYAWFRGHRRPRETWERTIVAMVLVPIWLAIALLVNEVFNHVGVSTFGTGYSSAFSKLGPNLSFVAVVPYAILHPSSAVVALRTEAIDKVAYILILLGSLAFLPLFGPKRLLLPAAGWLLLVSLSNGSSLTQFGVQDVAYAFSFLVPAVPFGVVRVSRWWTRARGSPEAAESPATPGVHGRWRRSRVGPVATASAIALALVVTSVTISPLLNDPAWSYPQISYGVPSVNQHDQALHQVIGLIPPAAGVLTVSPVFPEISSRVHAYVDPISSSFRPNLTFIEALDGYVNQSNYVLLDYFEAWFDSSVVIHFANLSGFGIVVEEDQIILYERGWTGSPALWTPFQRTWCGGQLGTTHASYVDPANATACGPALSSRAGPPLNALLWYGPYMYGLPPGRYSVTLWMSAEASKTGHQVRADSVSYPLVLNVTQRGPTSAQHSYGFSFAPEGNQTILNSTYITNPGFGPGTINENLTMTFEWGNLSAWGVAGWVYAPGTTIHLFSVSLEQLSL